MNTFSNTGWIGKFKNAVIGIAKGVRGENSFYVHIPMSIAVLALAITLRLDWVRISILLLCVGVVWTCELFNSAVERLGKSITKEFDQNVGDALDIASGAVLIASLFAAIIGLVILLPPAYCWLFVE